MGSTGDQTVRTWRVMYICILLVFNFVLYSCSSIASAATATPTVTPTNENYPIKVGILNPNVIVAVVRVVGTNYIDDFDNNELALPSCFNGQLISVWSPGYFISTITCNGITPEEYYIQLTPIDANSIVTYSWLPASSNCVNCHSQSSKHNVYDEWNHTSHASMFRDGYFESIYSGRNRQSGIVGSQAQWTVGDNGIFRVLPESVNSQNYTGLGFRLDHQSEYGNCVFCHVPAAVGPQHTNVDLLSLFSSPGGAVGEGITCDICHKVAGAVLDDKGFPYPDQPGVLSFQYPSSQNNSQFSFGPFSYATTQNVPAHLVSCSSIYSESRFCASCHYWKSFDTVIYNSYGEWLNSSYSMRGNASYRSCQDCHMISSQQVGNTPLAEQNACSATDSPVNGFSHNMMMRDNNGIPALVSGAAKITIVPKSEDRKVNLVVTVVNIKAGHKFPTDSPLRHLILVIEAKDSNGIDLVQLDGPIIPPWGGTGTQKDEDYAGLPGEIYANILMDKDTNAIPSIAYWNPTIHAWEGSDTRLIPGNPVQKEYSFVAPYSGQVRIIAKLIYRYAFIDIIRAKGWNLQDVPVTSIECTIDPSNPETWKCPPSTP